MREQEFLLSAEQINPFFSGRGILLSYLNNFKAQARLTFRPSRVYSVELSYDNPEAGTNLLKASLSPSQTRAELTVKVPLLLQDQLSTKAEVGTISLCQ